MGAFSRTGGTAGWLLNLHPGTRGYGLQVSYDGQRTNGPGALVTPLRSPTLSKESALYVVNYPKATPRCGSQLHGGPRTLHSMRLPEPAP